MQVIFCETCFLASWIRNLSDARRFFHRKVMSTPWRFGQIQASGSESWRKLLWNSTTLRQRDFGLVIKAPLPNWGSVNNVAGHLNSQQGSVLLLEGWLFSTTGSLERLALQGAFWKVSCHQSLQPTPPIWLQESQVVSFMVSCNIHLQ